MYVCVCNGERRDFDEEEVVGGKKIWMKECEANSLKLILQHCYYPSNSYPILILSSFKE